MNMSYNFKRTAFLFLFVVIFISCSSCCRRNFFMNDVYQCGEMVPVTFSKYGTNTSLWDVDCVGDWKPNPSGSWYVCDCTNKLKFESFDRNMEKMKQNPSESLWCEEKQ